MGRRLLPATPDFVTKDEQIPVIDANKAAQPVAGPRTRLALYCVWLALALFLAVHHVVWRDEVRALTFALSGDTIGAMLRNLHGEGHPALWYLMLRGAHALWPHPQVLVVTGFLVGAAASLIFAMRAPFGWPLLALGLFGRFALYEYTVMARNYGITMLILYALVWAYPRHRDKGWVAGLLLLLLCNTNFPAIVLAASFLLFWAIDLQCEAPWRWDRRWLAWGVGALLALAGVMLCVAEVYPPVNDAAPLSAPKQGWLLGLLTAFLRTGSYYDQLVPHELMDGATVIMPLLLFGLLWQWRRDPGALAAGIAAIFGLMLIFALIYKGEYRHQALLLPFLLTIAWLRAKGHGGSRTARDGRFAIAAEPYARIAFCALLALQVFSSVPYFTRIFRHMPESRSYELAQILRRPDLRDAIVISDPDFMLDVLPYYVSNPTYMLRERRWGPYAIFSKAAKRTITTDDILDTARRLHTETGRSVVILLFEPTYRNGAPGDLDRTTYGNFAMSWDGYLRMKANTHLLANFAHITNGDETYEVRLFDGQPDRGFDLEVQNRATPPIAKSE